MLVAERPVGACLALCTNRFGRLGGPAPWSICHHDYQAAIELLAYGDPNRLVDICAAAAGLFDMQHDPRFQYALKRPARIQLQILVFFCGTFLYLDTRTTSDALKASTRAGACETQSLELAPLEHAPLPVGIYWSTT